MRSPEQKAADEQLTAAIERVKAAYFPDDAGIVGDYVVAFASNYIDPDDEQVEAHVVRLVRDGSMPVYRAEGLLHLALYPSDEED